MCHSCKRSTIRVQVTLLWFVLQVVAQCSLLGETHYVRSLPTEYVQCNGTQLQCLAMPYYAMPHKAYVLNWASVKRYSP